MCIAFLKYQGAGNDFIVIDNLQGQLPKTPSKEIISKWCDRHFGVGADGCIILEPSATADFYMRYFNADGSTSTLCGNGARCAVAFAHRLQHINTQTHFEASDGLHHATFTSEERVSLKMQDVKEITQASDYSFVHTGSPHHLIFLPNADALEAMDVVGEGRKIRNSAAYGAAGTNVNFIAQQSETHLLLRTYERGVENETLACGTGAVAAALGAYALQKTKSNALTLQTRGGVLEVSFKPAEDYFENIYLSGPASFVFEGYLNNVSL